jgi:hypothetical protein
MLNEGNKRHIFISSFGSGTVINYGSGSDFLTSYGSGSGSASQNVTAPQANFTFKIFIQKPTLTNFSYFSIFKAFTYKGETHKGGWLVYIDFLYCLLPSSMSFPIQDLISLKGIISACTGESRSCTSHGDCTDHYPHNISNSFCLLNHNTVNILSTTQFSSFSFDISEYILLNIHML